MAAETWIALIGVGGTVLGSSITPVIAARLQERRSDKDALERLNSERRLVVEQAANAFINARVQLDQAITGQTTKLDSVAAFLPMAQAADRLTLHFGAGHNTAVNYKRATERWAEALNLALTHPGEREQIASARNDAEQFREQFLEAGGEALTGGQGSRPRWER